MHARKKLAVVDGWPGKHVEYLSTYNDGSTQKCLCSLDEWEAWEVKQKLIKSGADEKLVDKLYDIGYRVGHEEAEMDYAERDAGESY